MIRLFYCHICDRYTDQAKAELATTVRVAVMNHIQHDPIQVIDETIVGKAVQAKRFYCCIDGSQLTVKDFNDEECPHKWEPFPSVVHQTCKYCGKKRTGKVMFDD